MPRDGGFGAGYWGADRGRAQRPRTRGEASSGAESGLELRTTGIVVAEAWRDEGGRQANLARLLRSIDVRPVDERMGRQAGALLAKSGTHDAADATIVTAAAAGDRILTGDPQDVGRLVSAARRAIHVVRC